MKRMILAVLILTLVCVTACSDSDTKATRKDTSCEKNTLEKGKDYSVVLTTNKGKITIDVDEDLPISAAHFIGLVEDGFYDGLTFHRTIPEFVIQGGDPNGNGTGSSKCKAETEAPTKDYAQKGVAWAKGDTEVPGSAGSQFFIITAPKDSTGLEALNTKSDEADGQSRLQYGYIGKVTSGYDVVEEIEALGLDPTGTDAPSEKVTITKAEVKS